MFRLYIYFIYIIKPHSREKRARLATIIFEFSTTIYTSTHLFRLGKEVDVFPCHHMVYDQNSTLPLNILSSWRTSAVGSSPTYVPGWTDVASVKSLSPKGGAKDSRRIQFNLLSSLCHTLLLRGMSRVVIMILYTTTGFHGCYFLLRRKIAK